MHKVQKDESSHLEFVLLPRVVLAPDVLLQVHVVFERLSGGREGDRGQKLNHQTTKHTHGKREGEKGKVEDEREGRGKQSFSFFIPRVDKMRGGRLLERKVLDCVFLQDVHGPFFFFFFLKRLSVCSHGNVPMQIQNLRFNITCSPIGEHCVSVWGFCVSAALHCVRVCVCVQPRRPLSACCLR